MDVVLNWIWQGGAVALATAVMLLALTRARANVRYMVCWAAVLFVVALPVLPSLRPAAIAPAFSAVQADAIVSLPPAWWMSTIVLLAAWAMWAAIQAVRFVSAVLAIRRARAHSRAFPSDVAARLPRWRRVQAEGRRATLVLSDAVTSAAVLGWGRPMIAVAPSLLNTLDADDLDRILVHEWAHVQRRDDLVNVAQIAVRAVAGWHPALWWIDRRLQIEREIACDELTVAITGSAKSYAQCLVTLASRKSAPPAMRLAPAALRSSDLHARVVKLLSPYPSIAPVWSRSIAAGIVAALCATSVGVGGVQLVEAAAIALPFVVSPQIVGPASGPRAAAVPPLMETPRWERRPTSRSAASQAPAARPSSSVPQPAAGAPSPPTSGDAGPVDPARAAVIEVHPGIAPELPGTAHTVAEHAGVTPEQPSSPGAAGSESPWSAVAAGGTAIGKKSKDAGVATAGFFTRVARRVAGSF